MTNQVKALNKPVPIFRISLRTLILFTTLCALMAAVRATHNEHRASLELIAILETRSYSPVFRKKDQVGIAKLDYTPGYPDVERWVYVPSHSNYELHCKTESDTKKFTLKPGVHRLLLTFSSSSAVDQESTTTLILDGLQVHIGETIEPPDSRTAPIWQGISHRSDHWSPLYQRWGAPIRKGYRTWQGSSLDSFLFLSMKITPEIIEDKAKHHSDLELEPNLIQSLDLWIERKPLRYSDE